MVRGSSPIKTEYRLAIAPVANLFDDMLAGREESI
jgi:hypothetical protein